MSNVTPTPTPADYDNARALIAELNNRARTQEGMLNILATALAAQRERDCVAVCRQCAAGIPMENATHHIATKEYPTYHHCTAAAIRGASVTP